MALRFLEPDPYGHEDAYVVGVQSRGYATWFVMHESTMEDLDAVVAAADMALAEATPEEERRRQRIIAAADRSLSGWQHRSRGDR